MIAIWERLSEPMQDGLLAVFLIIPLVGLSAGLLRGFRPLPLVVALLWRFRWANLSFVLLIAVSVGMSVGLTAQERGLRHGMAQSAAKFDLVVSAPGSELTMMLAAVYLQASNVPLLDGTAFNAIADHPMVDIAAPIAFGDSYNGAPVVGTVAGFVTHLSEGNLAGRIWQNSSEAVVGAAVPLEIGAGFTPAHGMSADADHGAHDGVEITVVGRMPRTGSPWDKALLVPVETVWEVHGLANGHGLDEGDRIGPPFRAELFPGTPAVIVKARSLGATYALRSEFNRAQETMAFFPGTVLSDLYRVMGDVRRVMSLMTLVTQFLVAASVLLGLLILSRLFQRQMAMLRALGAPARFVLAVVWCYAFALLAMGMAIGLLFGFGASAALSAVVTQQTDILVTAGLGAAELHLALAFLAVAGTLSLLPALAVLRRPIVEALRA